MPENKINILSTRPLDQKLIEEAASKNIFIECISFIETEMMLNDILKEKILSLAHQQINVVFTSMNSVEAVAKHLVNIKPNWKIFCIGSATKDLVKKYFAESSIAEIADAASVLADRIILQNNISSVIFFCGDQRRDELPEKLAQHKIEVKEIEVYKTIALPEKINVDYDAIIFYSPSAVESFFSVNKINKHTILFAIGNTTASEIKKYSCNKIVVAENPSKKLLAEQAINYFETNPSSYSPLSISPNL
jgi:uroporphyrinogen-III synthase